MFDQFLAILCRKSVALCSDSPRGPTQDFVGLGLKGGVKLLFFRVVFALALQFVQSESREVGNIEAGVERTQIIGQEKTENMALLLREIAEGVCTFCVKCLCSGGFTGCTMPTAIWM